MRRKFEQLQSTFVSVRQNFTFAEEQEYIRLQAKLEEISAKFRNLSDRKTGLVRKSMNRTVVTETVVNKDERVENLKSRLNNLI